MIFDEVLEGFPPSSPRAGVTWQAGEVFIELNLVAQADVTPGVCPYAERGLMCRSVGATPEGAAIRGARRLGDPNPGYRVYWVDVKGGRWSLTRVGPGHPETVDVAEAVQVLARLQPVGIDRYMAVAGRAESK